MNADGPQKGRFRSFTTSLAEVQRSNHQHVPHHSLDCGTPAVPDEDACKKQQQVLVPVTLEASFWGLSRVDYDVLSNALACAGASMADPLMSLVDTAFVGRLGLIPLAALGPNAALFNVIFFLCFTPLAVICTQAMASAHSKGDLEGVGRGFFQALAAMAAVSCILVLLLVLLPEQVLQLFQTNAEIMPFARTYCCIRALSLPAALSMAVCQAAFRSLLDLKTPFMVVMTASAANYLLDDLFMFRMGGGIAGCGWASVLSQYIGAAMFAGIIYMRRHQFGLPAALHAAPNRYYARYGTSISGLLPKFYGGSSSSSKTKVGSAVQQLLPPLRPEVGPHMLGVHGERGAVGGAPRPKYVGSKLKRSDRGDVVGAEQQGRAVQERCHSQQGQYDEGTVVLLEQEQHGGHHHPYHPHHQPGQVLVRRVSDPGSKGLGPLQEFTLRDHHRGNGGSSSGPGGPAAAAAAAAPPAGGDGDSSVGSSSSSNNGLGGPLLGHSDHDEVHAPLLQLSKSDRQSSDSKLFRPGSPGLVRKAAMAVLALEWKPFSRRFAALTTRGLLILSTYTSASVVAARNGTSMIAGHQVVQQQQQMQMSIAWSFLHVGQSMVANVFHSPLPLGPKAARLLASRIIAWAFFLCTALAAFTWLAQEHLSRQFVKDPGVLQLVKSAAVPATLMLATAWNNALEGCLLGADDNAYVVKVYPVAVAVCLVLLARAATAGTGLTGVWWGLWTYYFVLLLGFAHRFWFKRSRI